MDHHSTIRSTANAALRWSGTLLCAILFLAWLSSGWFGINWDFKPAGTSAMHGIGFGCSHGGLTYDRALDEQGMSGWLGPLPGCKCYRIDDASQRWQLWFEYRHAPLGTITFWHAFIPLWAPLLACGLPTLWLWRRTKRARAGFCPCGYLRTGLAEDAICPECGRAEPRESRVGHVAI